MFLTCLTKLSHQHQGECSLYLCCLGLSQYNKKHFAVTAGISGFHLEITSYCWLTVYVLWLLVFWCLHQKFHQVIICDVISRDLSGTRNLSLPLGYFFASRPIGTLPTFKSGKFQYFFMSAPPSLKAINRDEVTLQELFNRGQKIRSRPSDGIQGEKLQYSFSLDRNLRLNLSLYNLYIPTPLSESALSFKTVCKNAYVEIRPLHATSACRKMYSNCLQYCGIHAHMVSYPNYAHCAVQIMRKQHTYLQVDMSYSVVDEGKIVSVTCRPGGTDLTKFGTAFAGYIPQFEYMTRAFHIRLVEYQQVHITSNYSECQMHNGPSKKSSIMQGAPRNQWKYYYVFSTFHATLHCLYFDPKLTNVGKWTFHIPNQVRLNFCGKINTTLIQTLDINQNSSISFPTMHLCIQRDWCILRLRSKHQTRINLTLTAWNYTGDTNTFDCDFAGVSVFNMTKPQTGRETITECILTYYSRSYQEKFYHKAESSSVYGIVEGVHCIKNVTSFPYQYPGFTNVKTIISRVNELFLVFYQYKDHGSFQVNVSAAVTSCGGVLLPACMGTVFMTTQDLLFLGDGVVKKTVMEGKWGHLNPFSNLGVVWLPSVSTGMNSIQLCSCWVPTPKHNFRIVGADEAEELFPSLARKVLCDISEIFWKQQLWEMPK